MLRFVLGYQITVPNAVMKTGTAISGPIRLKLPVMGGLHHYVSRNVRDKQPPERKESNNIDRTRRHAQNGHEQPVECMLRRLL
jgi:hypothetical protein